MLFVNAFTKRYVVCDEQECRSHNIYIPVRSSVLRKNDCKKPKSVAVIFLGWKLFDLFKSAKRYHGKIKCKDRIAFSMQKTRLREAVTRFSVLFN